MSCENGVSIYRPLVNGVESEQYKRIQKVFTDAENAYKIYSTLKVVDNVIDGLYSNEKSNERISTITHDRNGERKVYFTPIDFDSEFKEKGRCTVYNESSIPQNRIVVPVILTPSSVQINDKRISTGNDVHITKDNSFIVFNRDTIIPLMQTALNGTIHTGKSSVNYNNSVVDTVRVIERNIRRMVPGVKISYFTGEGNHHVKDGVVYLNKNKLSTNSYVHEFAHIFSMAWKNANPMQYKNAIAELKNELEGTKEYTELRERYKDYTDEDFEMELIAHVMEGYTLNKMAYSEMPLEKKSRIVTLIKNIIQSITKTFNTIMGFNVTKSLAGMTFWQLNDGLYNSMMGNQQFRFTSQEIYTMNYHRMFEKIDRPITFKTTKDLFEHLITDEEVYNELPLERQVEIAYGRLKKIGSNYIVMVNGTTIQLDTNEPTTVKNKIREVIEKGKHQGDVFIKNFVKNTFSLFGTDDGQNIKILKSALKENNINLSNSTIKQLYRELYRNPGTKVVRLSELEDELAKMGIKMGESLHKDLMGFDPLVSIEFTYTTDNKTIPVVSIFDVTTESLRYQDSMIGPGHILKRFNRDNIKGLTLKNSKEDIRKLILGMVANRLSRNGIHVATSEVIGLYANEGGRDSMRIALVDQVDINRNMVAMSNQKEFMDNIESDEIKKEFDANNMVDKQITYTDTLINYWNSIKDDFYDYGIEIDDIRNHKTDLIRLIKLRMNSYEKDPNKYVNDFEYQMLTNALVELEKLHTINGQFNKKAHLTTISKLIKPSFGIGNDIIQAMKAGLQRVSNILVNKVKEWDNVFESKVFKVYNELNPQSALKYVKSEGSKLFEKSYATLKVKDIDGNESNVKLNYLLWTTDESEDPLFAEQAKKLDRKILEANRIVVEKIYELMIDVAYHDRINNFGYNKKDGTKYTREDAKDYVDNVIGYKKGFMPVISKTVGEMMSQGDIRQSVEHFIDKHRNAEILYENASKDEMMENAQADLSFQLMDSMRTTGNGLYGSAKMLSKIGLQYDMQTGDLLLVDKTLNDSMSTNLEIITKYSVLSANRKIAMEQEIVPLANAALRIMEWEKERGIKNDDEYDYLKKYIEGKIYNQSGKTTGKIFGQSIEPFIAASMKTLGTTALALNINVAFTSFTWNMSNVFAEGLAGTFAKIVGVENGVDFTMGDVTKAITRLITNPKLMLAIAHKMNMINENESDIVNHWVNTKTKQSLISEHIAHIGNWATDVVGKVICMGAQLEHDGSLEAYSLDSNGELIYDENKDKKYQSADGKKIKEHVKKLMVEDGLMGSTNEKMPFGLDYYQIRKIKTVASKWVLGPYESQERAMMNHYILGRMFSQFKQFMYSRIDNAFSSGEYIDEIGSWKVVKDKDGKEMIAWDKRFSEGYLVSVLNSAIMIKKYLKTGKMDKLNDVQKVNLLKAASRVIVFLILYMLYNGITDDDDDKEDIGIIGERRFTKNIKFAYQEFLIISPTMWTRMLGNPFAATSIIDRVFDDKLGGTPFGRAAKTFAIGYPTFSSVNEMLKSDETLKKERIQKAKETRMKNKQKKAEEKNKANEQ